MGRHPQNAAELAGRQGHLTLPTPTLGFLWDSSSSLGTRRAPAKDVKDAPGVSLRGCAFF